MKNNLTFGKLASTLFFAFVISGTLLNAQNSNKWIISGGFNTVDIRTPDDFGGVLKDYFGPHDWNLVPYPSKLTVERSLNKNFSMQLGFSVNKIKKGFGWEENDPESDTKFFAIDGKLKYDLNNLIGDTKWFDPFLTTGFGVAEYDRNAMFNLKAGWGFNAWFSDNWGVTFDSGYNHNFEDSGNDYFQHTLGLSYRFDYPKDEVTATDLTDSKWILGAGINFIDIRTPDTFKEILHDYFNGDIDDVNAGFYPRLTAERKLNDAFGVQLGLSLATIEKGFNYNVGDPLGDDKFLAIDAKAKYDLNNLIGETAWFDPYIALGIGYSKIGDNGDFKVNGAYGANFWVFENVGLNLESSYNHAFNSNGTDYFQHSAGVVYHFGGAKKIKDSDGDGINDDEDKCPYEFGVPSLQGCPEPVRPIETDSDEDGILDKDDRCPNEKGFIENQGCPWPDTDGDGILDKDDKCPNEKGVASNNGCPVEEVKTTPVVDNTALLNELAGIVVYFDFDKDNIKSSETSKLDRMASIINQLGSGYTYDIQGNTDEIGSQNYNHDLSQRRANAVIDYLIAKGISKSSFSSDALGETNAVSDSNALNRRVEIKIK